MSIPEIKMPFKFSTVLSIVVLICFVLTFPAFAETKLAFVVGIDDYPNLGHEAHLQRAVTDAESMAAALEKIGFIVTKVSKDKIVTRLEFYRNLDAWAHKISPSDTVFFYFSGHGIGINRSNYLIPSDMPNLEDLNEFLFGKYAISEEEIRERIHTQGAHITILMLDACRNNPFRSRDRSIDYSRGLQRIESTEGILAIYAASEGQTALDRLSDTNDPNPNSVFTRVVLTQLQTPGLNLIDFSENIREDVKNIARSVGHEQIPAVENQLSGARSVFLGPPPAPKPVTPPIDDTMWHYLQDSSDIKLLRQFVIDYPASGHRHEAESRIDSLTLKPDDAAWRYIQDATDVAVLHRFMSDYPNSLHHTEAERRIAALQQPGPDEILWGRLQNTGDIDALHRFLSEFPLSKFGEDARKRLDQIDQDSWEHVNVIDAGSIRSYLFKFPQGIHALTVHVLYKKLDDETWREVPPTSTSELEKYLKIFPDGMHVDMARSLLAKLDAGQGFELPSVPVASKSLHRRAVGLMHRLVRVRSQPRHFHSVTTTAFVIPSRLREPTIHKEPIHRQLPVRSIVKSHAGGCFTFGSEKYCQ